MALIAAYLWFALVTGVHASQCNGTRTIYQISEIEEIVSCKVFYGNINIAPSFSASFSTWNGTVNLTGLESITGDFVCDSNLAIKELASDTLLQVGGNFVLNKLNELSFMSLSNLASVGQSLRLTNSSLSVLELPRLETVGALDIYGNNNLTSLNFASLTEVGGLSTLSNVTVFRLEDNENLHKIEGFPSLTSIEGTASIRGDVQSIESPRLQYVRHYDIHITDNNQSICQFFAAIDRDDTVQSTCYPSFASVVIRTGPATDTRIESTGSEAISQTGTAMLASYFVFIILFFVLLNFVIIYLKRRIRRRNATRAANLKIEIVDNSDRDQCPELPSMTQHHHSELQKTERKIAELHFDPEGRPELKGSTLIMELGSKQIYELESPWKSSRPCMAANEILQAGVFLAMAMEAKLFSEATSNHHNVGKKLLIETRYKVLTDRDEDLERGLQQATVV